MTPREFTARQHDGLEALLAVASPAGDGQEEGPARPRTIMPGAALPPGLRAVLYPAAGRIVVSGDLGAECRKDAVCRAMAAGRRAGEPWPGRETAPARVKHSPGSQLTGYPGRPSQP